MKIARSAFIIIEKAPYGAYTLLSEKYNKRFKMVLTFYSINEPSEGDVLELPDCMLYEEKDRPMFSNHMLSFGIPTSNCAVPEGFPIEEDYAYLHYRKANETIRIQRYYG